MHGQLHELPNQMAVVEQISKHATSLGDSGTAGAQIHDALSSLISANSAPVTVEVPLDQWSAEATPAGTAAPDNAEVDLDAINIAADLLANARTRLSAWGVAQWCV